MTYLKFAREICSTDGEHYQGYVEFKNAKSIKAAQAALGLSDKNKFFKRKGSPSQAADYCGEDGKDLWGETEEFGERRADPNPGERTDISHMKRAIDEGASELDCWELDFNTMSKYYKGMGIYMDLKKRAVHRTDMTEGFWYHGDTGAGKSHKAFENFDPETHYVVPLDDKWWDGYTGQETVIVNEFRGEIPYRRMLDLTDKWPTSVPRRGREPMPFTSKKIIVTSALPPEEVYCRQNEKTDSIDQLLRRFTVVKFSNPLGA